MFGGYVLGPSVSLGPSLSWSLLGLSSGDNPLLERAGMPELLHAEGSVNYSVRHRRCMVLSASLEACSSVLPPLCLRQTPLSGRHHVLNWRPAAVARGDFPSLLLQMALPRNLV